MARDDPQLKLRLPAALKAHIETLAQAAGRSINAEIVQRLETSLTLNLTIPTGAGKSAILLHIIANEFEKARAEGRNIRLLIDESTSEDVKIDAVDHSQPERGKIE